MDGERRRGAREREIKRKREREEDGNHMDIISSWDTHFV